LISVTQQVPPTAAGSVAYLGSVGFESVELEPGNERFTSADLLQLTYQVGQAWTAGADRDWSVPAGTLEWSCLRTADHAVDCVYAPAFFLASRRVDHYPDVGFDLTIGTEANPPHLVESLQIATRILVAVVNDAGPEVRAVIFRRPRLLVAPAQDFLPRAAMELILHAHDVCTGLRVPFEPPDGLCYRLREHTRHWPMWGTAWATLDHTEDPWADLLRASGRRKGDGQTPHLGSLTVG
jgi:hypothetical protein